MQQERHARRKPFPKILPFVIGASAAAVVLVACDRPDARPDVAASAGEAAPVAPMNVPAPRADVRPAPQPSSSPLPPREALEDTVITGRIKAELLTDPAMQGADISVNTDRGVVALAGLVRSPEQTALASAHAQRQDGVMRVDNHLALAPE
jgi:hypothetical protein